MYKGTGYIEVIKAHITFVRMHFTVLADKT